MPGFVSEFSAALSLKGTKRKWYHWRQLQDWSCSLCPGTDGYKLKTPAAGQKNMKVCCIEQGIFWWILHCVSDKWHRRRDEDRRRNTTSLCFLRIFQWTQHNPIIFTQSHCFSFFFFTCRKYSSLSGFLWCYSGANKCYIFQVPRHLASSTWNRGGFTG